MQAPLAQLLWGHNLVLLEKLDEESARMWYAQMALSEVWSRNHLLRQIEALRKLAAEESNRGLKFDPSMTRRHIA